MHVSMARGSWSTCRHQQLGFMHARKTSKLGPCGVELEQEGKEQVPPTL